MADQQKLLQIDMTVELYFWDIPKTKIFPALLRISRQFISLRMHRDISFFKLLGTGKGETFTPRDANLKRWGLLVVSKSSSNLNAIKSWQKIATSEKYFQLSPIAAHGKWAQKSPFQISTPQSTNSEQGTFSIWKNEASINDFAFKEAAHALVIRKTHEIGWYSEELFARFEVISKAE